MKERACEIDMPFLYQVLLLIIANLTSIFTSHNIAFLR